MGWRRTIEQDRTALKRVVALLLALADLAELAAGRPFHIRTFVCWLLRYAEVAAGKLVQGGHDTALPSTPGHAPESGPADAIRLAARLRALAMQIDLLAKLAFAARRIDDAHAKPPGGGGSSARDVLAALSTVAALAGRRPHAVQAPDTS